MAVQQTHVLKRTIFYSIVGVLTHPLTIAILGGITAYLYFTEYDFTFQTYLTWLIIWSGATFLEYLLDKYLASTEVFRIPEIFLKVLALLGGALGAVTGSLLLQHKMPARRPRIWLVNAYSLVLHSSILVILVPNWPSWTGFNGKSLWDLADIALIPLVLVVGGYLLNQATRKADQEIATDNQQETLLQDYLERMSKLLLEERLEISKPEDKARDMARTWTLTSLRRLNGERKGIVVQFLYEADLIKTEPVISLSQADLKGAELSEMSVRGVNLEDARLDRAKLRNTHLFGANLKRAKLSYANLMGADLREANMEDADLQKANLSFAIFSIWQPSRDRYNRANLRGAKLIRAELYKTDLHGADLEEAQLNYANLEGATLPRANLYRADLRGANLSGANLNLALLHEIQIDEETRLDEKWRLVWEIGNKGGAKRNLENAELSYANLGTADLSEAKLSGAQLDFAILNEVNLTSTDLKNASLQGADLTGANLLSADLSGANLSGAVLKRVDLSRTKLNKTNLSGAICDSATQWPEGFDPDEAGVSKVE